MFCGLFLDFFIYSCHLGFFFKSSSSDQSFPLSILCRVSKNLEVGTGAEVTKESCLLTGLFSWLPSLLGFRADTAHSELDLATWNVNQKMHPGACLEISLVDDFLSSDFVFHNDSSLCQFDINTSQHIWEWGIWKVSNSARAGHRFQVEEPAFYKLKELVADDKASLSWSLGGRG